MAAAAGVVVVAGVDRMFRFVQCSNGSNVICCAND